MTHWWWVTRPEPQASQWVQALGQAGIEAKALPLIRIEGSPTPSQLQDEALALMQGERDAVMFVSVNAAHGLLQGQPGLAAKFGSRLRAWTAGPGTAKALQQLGVSASAIDQPAPDAAQFDSEALWQRVAQQVCSGYRVSFMRGAETSGQVAGRDWLSEQVLRFGGQVTQVASYCRSIPSDLPEQLQANGLPMAPGAWLFSSSHALQNLRRTLPQADWRAHRALCTHERIARLAEQMGFGSVRVCRPRLGDVIESIKSWP